jgi:hypothetical protein
MEGLGRAVLDALPLCLERASALTFLPICDGSKVSLPGEGQHSASAWNDVFGFCANEMTWMRLRLLEPTCLLGRDDATPVAPSD